MTSIFKVIRDNDVQLLNYLIDEDHSTFSKGDLKRVKHLDLNKRSVNGRTALHCAVTWNRVEMVQALMHCPSVNINLCDRENGWTALHRALYMGNIEISRILLAREDIDLSIKDWEGLDAFELFNSTISETFPKQQIQFKKMDDDFSTSEYDETYHIQQTEDGTKLGKGGTDLYTWGHNTNYVLGHADSENRVKPERVHLSLYSQKSPCIMTRPTCVIESISMSKYHMAILTSELQYNLLVCGFGRGGRLGTGKETQFTPIPVQWPERIVSVALGRDHTIAITASGNVITFGQNSFGQLGYETENPMQLVPRKIQAQSLKKQSILGAAASTVHSVVYTSTEIFTFGYNHGQLGYFQPDNESCQVTPRKVSTMSADIIQVVANDNVTAILTNAHDIILLCNFTQKKLFLPIQRFPTNIQVHRSEPNFAVKLISSGSEYLGAVTNAGDVFIWTCQSPPIRQSGKKFTGNTTVSTPKRVWTVRKPHLAAVDASIGQHGEVVICTLSGHVFIGRPESNGYKFNQVPSIQRCIQVCANSSGAFAAIRSEYQLQPITNIPSSTLVPDMVSSLPHIEASIWLKNELDKHKKNEIMSMKNILDKYTKSNSSRVDVNDTAEYEAERETVRKIYNEIRMNCIDDAWKRSDGLAYGDSTLDIILAVDGKNIYCHSTILRCRSDMFKRLVKCKDRGNDIKIHLNKRDGKIEIQIDHCQLAAVLLLLDFMYTDEYQHPMSLRFEMPVLSSMHASNAKNIQRDLLALAKIFHIPNLIATAQENYYRKTCSLQGDLKQLLEKRNGTDVIIKTSEENEETTCHQIILRQRCDYFGNILKAGSVWVQDRMEKADGCIQVNLDHISKQVMDTIIQYIYTDEDGSSLFNHIEKDKEESMMYFLLSILCEADALLLTRLKTITESALVRFIKLRSAAIIFEYADAYLAESLKESCLQFISVNLPAFLGSSMLDFIPAKLVRDLENYVRRCQIQETPTVSRGCFNFTADESYLEVEDPEFSTSIYALGRGDGSISSFLETLVTLRPSKHPDPIKSPITEQIISPVSPASPKTEGRMKKGVRVSLDNLENELNSLAMQPRRRSSRWLVTSTEEVIESKPSLREIIETENQPIGSGSKTAKSYVPKKVSQKERRKLMQDHSAESSSSSTKHVWGKVATVEAQPITKPDESSDRKGKKIYVPEELLDEIEDSRYINTTTTKINFNPIESLGSSFNMTPIRRLNLSISSSDSKKSFQTIQKQQQEDNWRKDFNPKKNIIKIQKEEQAIEGIAQYYVQTLDIMSGEWYEVHRISTR